MRIGVLGGTFDPIHYGHLIIADSVREQLELDLMLFVPSGEPPHRRDQALTSAEHRYLMTVLATTGHPQFRVSRLELNRPGPSYTVDTLQQLRDEFEPGTELNFVLGIDAFQHFATWHRPERILELSRLIVVTRAGYDSESVDQQQDALPAAAQNQILLLTVPSPHISASELRRRLRDGRSVRYLLPPLVLSYIQQHGLYGVAARQAAR